MRLRDILKDSEVHITYRTDSPFEKDILYGYCTWTGKELISEDMDIYSVDDIIDGFAWTSDSDLIVWYKSTWIT